MLLRTPEPVLMLVADISGYTMYLAGTEIEHAQNVLEDLLDTVHARLVPPFTLVKAEGDALFVFAPGGSVSGDLLLDTLDACYFGFRRRLRDVTQATTCECNACVLIPKLDLKFVVHAGQAIRQSSFGVLDLVGTDVVTIHRLLKNHVVEEHGWRAYAFISQAAIDAVGLDCLRLGMLPHHEEYDDAGPVDGFVQDLDARWTAEETRTRRALTPAQAKWSYELDLPASAPVVWEWITSPRRRPLWARHILRVDQDTTDGRAGVGTMNHCVHGREVMVETVLEWQPFETTSVSTATQIGQLLSTFVLTAAGTGTHLAMLCDLPDPGSDAVLPVVRQLLDERFGVGLRNLAEILAAAADDVAANDPGVDSVAAHS